MIVHRQTHNSDHPMIEPLLCGIVLGLIPVTLVGLFVAAWNQYRRGSALGG
jgi:cytochrome b6-f complex subunit 5